MMMNERSETIKYLSTNHVFFFTHETYLYINKLQLPLSLMTPLLGDKVEATSEKLQKTLDKVNM